MSKVNDQTLLKIIHKIFTNIGFMKMLQDVQELKHQQIYFDLCKIIFPLTSNQINQLSKAQLSTGQKIQGIIDIFSKQIRMTLSHISGEAISRGQPNHLYNLLQLFEESSKYYFASQNDKQQQSYENSQQEENQKSSEQQHESQQDIQQEQKLDNRENEPIKTDDIIAQKKQKVRQEVRNKPVFQGRQANNLQDQIVDQVRRVKANLSKLKKSVNRKQKNEDIIQMKRKYKSYLKDFVKQKKVTKKLQKNNASRQNINKRKVSTTLKEQYEIQLQQKAIQLQLRDNKTKYLRHINQLVTKLEKDKVHNQKKQQKQFQNELNAQTYNKIQSIKSKHAVTRQILKQRQEKGRDNFIKYKEGHKKLARQIQKQFKRYYEDERQKYRNRLREKNNKLIYLLQDPSALQNLIVSIYKKY